MSRLWPWLLLLLGCAPADRVSFRIVAGLDDDPFATGSDLAISLVGAEQPDERVFPITATVFELPELPYGEGLRFRVEARTAEIVFARGASFPFDYLADGPPPRAPHVLLGTLGRMSRTTLQQPDAPALVVAAADDGARFVTELGTIYAYRAHGPEGAASLEVLGRAPPHRATGGWAAVGRLGFVVVGGRSPGASFVDAATGDAIELSAGLEAHQQGATVVGFERGALVIGGIVDRVGRAEVTWIEPRDGELVATSLPPLGAGVYGARGVALLTRDAAGGLASRALVLGGSSAPAVWVVDPSGAVPIRNELVLADVSEAGIATIGPQLVLITGGVVGAAPSDRMDLLIVDERGAANQLHPRPLAAPRRGPGVIAAGGGRALVVGGRGRFGLAHDTAELFEVSLADLPGDVVPTGRAPTSAAQPQGVLLDDGTVLVLDDGLAAIYFLPRGP